MQVVVDESVAKLTQKSLTARTLYKLPPVVQRFRCKATTYARSDGAKEPFFQRQTLGGRFSLVGGRGGYVTCSTSACRLLVRYTGGDGGGRKEVVVRTRQVRSRHQTQLTNRASRRQCFKTTFVKFFTILLDTIFL